VPFTDPTGQASTGHQSGPHGAKNESGWRRDTSRGGSTSGRAGTTFTEYWIRDNGDKYRRDAVIDHREGEENSVREVTTRADGSGEGTHIDYNTGRVVHVDVAADGTVTIQDSADSGEEPTEKADGDKPKDKYPNESASRGGIICFTELQCRDAMEKAEKARKKRPGPGGMPTETTGIPARSGPGTEPGAATDPNPDDLGIRGGGGGGGGQSGPPIRCVGEDCERPSESGTGTGSKPPVPGGPSR
jgi:hypothetical protein